MKVAMALAIENRLRDRVHRDIYWRLAAVKMCWVGTGACLFIAPPTGSVVAKK